MKSHGATPWTPLRKPLAAARVALLTFAGVHHKTQEPFDTEQPRGDWSFRLIDGDAPTQDLRIRHGHYDQHDAEQDVNCVFPLDRLRLLASLGEIGAAAPVHIGMMGYIPDPTPLVAETMPRVLDVLTSHDVDVVVLSPG